MKGHNSTRPLSAAWTALPFRVALYRPEFTTERMKICGKTVTLRPREIVAYWPPLSYAVKVVITRDPKRPKRTAFVIFLLWGKRQVCCD